MASVRVWVCGIDMEGMSMPGMLVVLWFVPKGRLYMMEAVWRCWSSLG